MRNLQEGFDTFILHSSENKKGKKMNKKTIDPYLPNILHIFGFFACSLLSFVSTLSD